MASSAVLQFDYTSRAGVDGPIHPAAVVLENYLCFKAIPKIRDSSQCNLHDFIRL